MARRVRLSRASRSPPTRLSLASRAPPTRLPLASPSPLVGYSYFERAKKKRELEKNRNPQSGELGFAAQPLREPVAVHAPHFPYERTEQWMVLLVDQKTSRVRHTALLSRSKGP